MLREAANDLPSVAPRLNYTFRSRRRMVRAAIAAVGGRCMVGMSRSDVRMEAPPEDRRRSDGPGRHVIARVLAARNSSSSHGTRYARLSTEMSSRSAGSTRGRHGEGRVRARYTT